MFKKNPFGENFFSSKNLKYDLKAGLIVFLVALPLCLGIAQSQGVDLFAGLISGIIGGILVGFISGSKLSVSGPAAGLTAIVIVSIQQLQNNFEIFLLALCIAGILQIFLGILKAGIIGHYIPSSVIKGMLCAIGIILIMKEIPHFLGDDFDPEGDESFIQKDGQTTFSELSNMLRSLSPGAMAIGSICLALLFLWEMKWVKRQKFLASIPPAMLVVLVGVLLNQLFLSAFPAIAVTNPEHLVSLPKINSAGSLFSNLHFPEWSAFTQYKVYEVAFTLCMVASLETLLSVEAIDKLDPENNITPTNRELIAQGIGNFICGLIGGIPITSVIVRSSANVNAGAKSQRATIIHGVLIIAAVFLIPGILQLIPNSALAAILIMTGLKLSRPMIFRNVYRLGWDQFLPFIVTIIVMLFTDLLKGVCVGIIVGVIFILRQNFRNPYKFVSDTIEGVPHYFIKLSQNVTFLNKGKIIETLHKIPPGSKVYIDGGRSQFIDKDVLEVITEFKQAAHINKIEVNLEDIEEVELISAH